jgi:hypothetical protein
MTNNLPDFEFAQRIMLALITAVSDDEHDATEHFLGVLAREFGMKNYFEAVVGVVE